MSYSGGEHFNKLAKSRGYRSRAAFKLHQINNKFNLLKKGCSVMDLGSSPGGWSQVAKELVGNSGKVFALDIIPMKPINGVEFIKFDFRDKDIKKFINLDFNVNKVNRKTKILIDQTIENFQAIYSDNCRVYIRPSGTEPVMRVLVLSLIHN